MHGGENKRNCIKFYNTTIYSYCCDGMVYVAFPPGALHEASGCASAVEEKKDDILFTQVATKGPHSPFGPHLVGLTLQTVSSTEDTSQYMGSLGDP